MTPLPPFQSYWVKETRWLAGIHPCKYPDMTRSVLNSLAELKIDVFIDVSAGEKPSYIEHLKPGIECHAFPIPSMGVPVHPGHMRRILDQIDKVLKNNRSLYLHCRSGRGRTGTVIGCWLVRHGLTGEAALDQLREVWSHSRAARNGEQIPETLEQETYIREWGNLREKAQGERGHGNNRP